MATRDFLVIRGGLDGEDGLPDLNIRRLPLSHDVIDSFVVVHPVPSGEPVAHPLQASRTVSLMPDGRFVCTEVSGEAGAVIGEPVRLSEAVEIANRVLRRGQEGDALDAHCLAVAYLGLIKTRADVAFPDGGGA